MRFLSLLKCKLQHAVVTHSSMKYQGSITLDRDIAEQLDLHEHEQVHINNATNGNRDITYLLYGERGSGIVAINGALSLRHNIGDTVHVLAYQQIIEEGGELEGFKPVIVIDKID